MSRTVATAGSHLANPGATAPRRLRRASLAPALLLLALTALSGCTSHAQRLKLARGEFYQGRFDLASEHLNEAAEKRPAEADVLALDLAMIELLSGNAQRSERLLRRVRDRFDHLEQRDLRESMLTWIADDTHRAYDGEDYEKVLIRVFLAISNLMHDGGDVTAYSFQINETQQRIIDAALEEDGTNPKADYNQVAIGPYLYGVIREATHRHYDDAERAYTKVVEWAPDFPAGPLDLERARHGVHASPGNGVLYVIALVGRGPYKEEVAQHPTTEAMLVADRILSMIGKHSLTPTLAPIKIPEIRVPSNSVDRVAVAVGDAACGTTMTITDVGRLAREQDQATRNLVMGKAIARRAVKKATLYAAKSATGTQGIAELAVDLVGVAWEAAESADTRCWGLLPETIQVLRVELPAGQHQVRLEPRLGDRRAGQAEDHSLPIVAGRNTFLLVHYPTGQRLGQAQHKVH